MFKALKVKGGFRGLSTHLEATSKSCAEICHFGDIPSQEEIYNNFGK
jgi:hypothetical protein